MAVTETERETEEEREDSREPAREERDERPEVEGSEEPEAQGSEEPEETEEQKQERAKRNRIKGIAAGVGIFLLLGLYFVWIGSEMGSHAISGTTEMWAIFGAIFLGVIAMVAGGAISRRRDD